MTISHTPTPWSVFELTHGDGRKVAVNSLNVENVIDNDTYISIRFPGGENNVISVNGAFDDVVEKLSGKCNAHDDLIAELEHASQMLEDMKNGQSFTPVYWAGAKGRRQKVLAKAKAGE